MRYYSAVIGISLAILYSCNQASRSENESQRLLLSGRALAEDLHFAEARKAYEKSLALDSLNADTHFELGNLNARLGRLNEAIQAYSASVTIDSSHYRARHNLAVIIADQGQLPQAIELLKELYDYTPAFSTLALFYTKQGRYDLAESILNKALRTNDIHLDERRQLGHLYLRQGRYGEAKIELDHALALDSTQTETHRLLGLLHLAEKHYEQALESFNIAIEYDPYSVEAHYNLASTLTALKREKKAREALARFDTLSTYAAHIARLRRQLDLDPDNLETHIELAYSYRRLGNDDAALTHYHSALDSHPENLETILALSGFLLEHGVDDEVIELSRKGIALNPKDIRISNLYFDQGYAHMRNKRYMDAISAFENAVDLDPSLAKAWNNLGNIHIVLGDTAAAQRSFIEAISANPQIAEAHYNLGSIYLGNSDLDRAEQAYNAAIRTDSTFARAFYALASIYHQIGRLQEAKQAYQAFIAKWQGDPSFLRQARQQLAGLDNPRTETSR